MKGYLGKAGMVALIALTMASEGCLVPWRKYIALKRKYDEAIRELAAKDSQLADANTRIEALREQLKAKDQLIALYADKGKDADERIRRAKEEFDRVMADLKRFQSGHPDVDVVDGTMIIKDELLFATGSDELSEAGRKLLQDFANQFKATGDVLQIDGHTDDVRVAKPATVARFGSNWGLSAFRAKAVLEFLAKSGLPESHMYLRAFSMYKPRLANTSDSSRAKNRRVEVMVFPPEALAPKPEGTKPEAPKPEAPKTEAPKPEPAKPAETK